MRNRLLIVVMLIIAPVLVMAQEPLKIEVSFDKKVVLLFETSINWHELGNHDQVVVAVDDYRCVIQTNGDYSSGFYPNNLQIETSDGSFYNFDLSYNNRPARTLVPVSVDQAVFRRKSRVVAEAQSEEDDTTGDKKRIIQKIVSEEKLVFGVEDGGVSFLFMGTYNTSDDLYFHVKVENDSDIPYDVDLISFFMVKKGSGSRKKSSSYKEPYLEGTVFNEEQDVVDRKSSVDYVCVFPKFTIDNDKNFHIEIYENGGDRAGVLKLKPADISSSEYIR